MNSSPPSDAKEDLLVLDVVGVLLDQFLFEKLDVKALTEGGSNLLIVISLD